MFAAVQCFFLHLKTEAFSVFVGVVMKINCKHEIREQTKIISHLHVRAFMSLHTSKSFLSQSFYAMISGQEWPQPLMPRPHFHRSSLYKFTQLIIVCPLIRQGL